MAFDKVRIADCCIIKPPKSEARKLLKDTDKVSFVPMRDLGIDSKYLSLKEERALSTVSGSYTYFADNDVLLAKITPCFENGKLGVASGLTNGVGFGSSEFIVLRSKGKVVPNYLYYFLSQPSFRLAGQAVMTGAVGHRRVPNDYIENTEIPLPSISEQERIVAILDETFADIEQVRAKTEQNLKNARELFESYLQQVFSQRGEEWIEKTLGDVCKFENGDRGKNYPSRSQFVESGFAFINAGHIDDGTVDFSKMNYITEENYDLLSRGKVKQGDILFCLRGSLGKFAVIEDDAQGAIASSLVIVRPHNDLSVSFLLHYLRSGLCKSMIEKYAGGAAQPNLGAKDLAKFSISVPPTAQQLHTSDKLDSLMVAVENLESVYSEKLAALDELKKSILQKAFSGELTQKNNQGAVA